MMSRLLISVSHYVAQYFIIVPLQYDDTIFKDEDKS
jgi:hypothetical protein